jgi:NTP pyrophosphatase (non-canonical NTP hydrolase)
MRTANGICADSERALLVQGVMGLCGEAGECIDLVKKHIYQGKELDKEHLAKELGDVAWYLATTAQAIGYDLETIFEMNIEKLRARYPNGFEVYKSENRAEGDI